jgi:hypothetical protein
MRSQFKRKSASIVAICWLLARLQSLLCAQDTTPPFVISAVLDCENHYRVNVTFSESVDDGGSDPFNYYLFRNADPFAPALEAMSGIVSLSDDSTAFAVTFAPGSFIPDGWSILSVNTIEDLAGNVIGGGVARYPVEVCAIPEPRAMTLFFLFIGAFSFFRWLRDRHLKKTVS